MSRFDEALGKTGMVLDIASRLGGPASAAIPLVSGIVKMIKRRREEGGEMEYTLVISVGQENIQAAEESFVSVLGSVNDELIRMGLEPVTEDDE